jgi:uncharacterized membrane-anchored protein
LVVKIVANPFGETFGDFLSMTLQRPAITAAFYY